MTQLFRKPAVRVAESGIYSGKPVICKISHFTNFPRNLVFSPYIRIGQFCNSLSCHGIVTMAQFLRKPAVWNIFRKTCDLRDFAFYKFFEDLGFQPLHKDWTILQQFIIPWYHYHIFSKTWNLRNFAFYKFSENLGFQPLYKDWTILQQFIIPWYHYHDTASEKPCSQGSWVKDIFSKTWNLRNFAFYKSSENLGFQPLYKDWTILQQFIIPWYHYHDTASQKPCS